MVRESGKNDVQPAGCWVCELVNQFLAKLGGWRQSTHGTCTSSSRGSKQKADKNVGAGFTSYLALREGKTTHSQPKAENQPNRRVSPSLVTLGPLSVSQQSQQQHTATGLYSSASPWGLLVVLVMHRISVKLLLA